MAWTSESLAAIETTDLALDYQLLGVQAIPVAPTTAKWTENNNCGVGTDRTSTYYPARRAYDGLVGYATTTDGTASNVWHLYIANNTAMTFDSVFLVGHNFGTLSLTTVQLQIADDAACSTNLQTIGDFGAPASNDRLADLVLHHGGGLPLRYTTNHVRLKLSRAANFTPSLTEVVLARRRQLHANPLHPYDRQGYRRSVESVMTEGGVTFQTEYFRNQRLVSERLTMHEDTHINNYLAFWQACRGPFVLVEQPSSAPAAWNMMMLTKESLEFPQIDWIERQTTLEAVEQGPEAYFLANE